METKDDIAILQPQAAPDERSIGQGSNERDPAERQQVEADEENEVGDLATAEATLIYQEAPIKGPAWLKEAAQTRAAFAQRLPGTAEWTIGNGSGSLSNLTPEERAKIQADDDAEWIEAFVERGEERLQQEREEWQREQHSYAGLKMTGKEWGEFGDELKRDTPLRQWLVAKMMKDGQTKEQAEKTANDVALRAQMNSIPQSQWTSEMKALDEEMKADPKRADKVNGYLHDAGVKKAELEGPSHTAADRISNTVSSTASTETRGELFGSAPDLMDHYEQAKSAKEPLDAAKHVKVATASPVVTPANNAGFDV